MDTSTTLPARSAAGEVVERFLAGYWCARTQGNCRFILTGWVGWCDARGHEVLAIDAAVVEAWVASMKTAGYAPNNDRRAGLDRAALAHWLDATYR